MHVYNGARGELATWTNVYIFNQILLSSFFLELCLQIDETHKPYISKIICYK